MLTPMAESPVAGNDVGTSLEIKRIAKIRLPDSGKWIVQNTGSNTTLGPAGTTQDKYAEWAEYAFVVRQKVYHPRQSDFPVITIALLIRSPLLRRDLRDVMKDADGISWNRPILKLDPLPLLNFLPCLNGLVRSLSDVPETEARREHLISLIGFLESEYAGTIQKVSGLVKYGEIAFGLIWAIFTPGEVIAASCETTGEPRAYLLRKIRNGEHRCGPCWDLTCDYIEAFNRPSSEQAFGLATHVIKIKCFEGVKQIAELEAYPIVFHSSTEQIREKLVQRGRAWVKLCGRHHRQYTGLAWGTVGRVQVGGRIMIDRGTFASANPNYGLPTPSKWRRCERDSGGRLSDDSSSPSPFIEAQELQDAQLLLASPVIFGFSFTEKRWLEFNIECISDIQWNDEGFRNLAIDPDRKLLVQSLVESHSSEAKSFDDFVTGKGVGLVINLFGPPGVGKTLTVEATSEHLKRPLYVVSAGELGTTPSALDKTLTEIFSLVPVWNAVLLIDEADVFLEERSTSDVQRNAMVAVFLRQLEYVLHDHTFIPIDSESSLHRYFQGLLFLTTNRIKNVDLAFHSRIHLSLHYTHLSVRAKEQLWRAFLEKARAASLPDVELKDLSRRNFNGRQIKNLVKLAAALARHEGNPMTYQHLLRTIGATEDWDSKEEIST
ncbi:p-loop containing nucleoside triphosphate hydrolase protein [Mycena venus]|uniref:p-loop containing nucleoside triphosphate hydrolase protein n=1 Tax=Mycena venus TaxID=2733690 RepID=A0A8H7D1Y3_9AGAR|nr:p-loop containing nucleoside triphosphate hydrolase protein [Mycena venus]